MAVTTVPPTIGFPAPTYTTTPTQPAPTPAPATAGTTTLTTNLPAGNQTLLAPGTGLTINKVV